MISIVIPCYNEGQKLINNLQKINKFMEHINDDYEIIVVNDGSTDDTYSILNSNLKSIKNTKISSYSINRGKGNAVRTGIQEAKGDYIFFMDADLSTDLEAIDKTLEIFKNNNVDIVIGNRRMSESTEKKGIIRKILSTGCHITTMLFTGLNYIDTQCGFKAFKHNIGKNIVSKQILERFAFDVEYLYIAKLNNYTIKEIPVIWNNDGDSRVKIVRDTIRFFKDLIVIRKNKKNYII